MNQAGLHVFKHKKRILYISTVRPQLFDANQGSISTGLAAILSTIKSYSKISRKQLAEKALAKLIGEKSTDESSAEYQHAKTTLATDLIWLAKAGHVIEFADGTLDLPLPPRPVEAGERQAHLSRPSRILETEESEGSPEEESSTAQLETDEMPAESEPELMAPRKEAQASEIARDEPDSNPEASLEPARAEAAAEPSLQLPTDPPELVETRTRIVGRRRESAPRERICFHRQPRLLISSCGSFDTLRKREISGLRPSNRAAVVSIFAETFSETSK